MTIIELARVNLLNGLKASDEHVHQVLRLVKDDAEDYNHLPTNFFEDLDDPSTILLIGTWQSQMQHAQGYVGSERQKKVLQMALQDMDISWMNYVDVAIDRIPTTAEILVISRHAVTDKGATDSEEARADFEEQWTHEVDKENLKGLSGGWRLPREDEEWKGDLWVEFKSLTTGSSCEDSSTMTAQSLHKSLKVMDSYRTKMIRF